MDINNRIPEIRNMLKDNKFTKKIKLYFSSASYGEYYDEYEDAKTFTNLNPKTIKGYVTQISAQKLAYTTYGLKEQGALEIICDKRYANYFKFCNKIEIDGESYQVYKEAAGSRSIVEDRKFKMLRVTLSRTGDK